MEKQTMSVKELAIAMGCSLPKAYELTERMDFPCIHLGRRKVIPLDGFKQWLERETNARTAA
jgi:excisionase family DNA binding protein